MNTPNIVLIMADQLAQSAIGALGRSAAITPNIDRLVAEGTTFMNAYCNSPLCAPSRASFATGRLPSSLGVNDNGSELPASVPTLFHHLRLAGYETVLSGKMHFVGPDQHHGFQHRLLRDIHTAGFDLTPDWSRGTYANPGTGVRRLAEAGTTRWNTQLAYDEKVHVRAMEKIRDIGRTPHGARDPFCMCVSYMHPHDPFEVPEPFWSLYDGVEIPRPAASSIPFDEHHRFNQWIQIHHELDEFALTDAQIRSNRRAYYGMVSYLDAKVGELIAELERMEVLDNTLVVITSDHGEMLGEHGMWFKRTFYEDSVKVPLIVWGPSRVPAGVRRDEVVSLVDLTATIADMAEAHACDAHAPTMDGESFLPLLTGEDRAWKDEAIFEYCGEGTTAPMVGLRCGALKYVAVAGERSLLFDLENDPLEQTNLIDTPGFEGTARELHARLGAYDLDALELDVLRSQAERLLILRAQRESEPQPWKPRISGLARDW